MKLEEYWLNEYLGEEEASHWTENTHENWFLQITEVNLDRLVIMFENQDFQPKRALNCKESSKEHLIVLKNFLVQQDKFNIAFTEDEKSLRNESLILEVRFRAPPL